MLTKPTAAHDAQCARAYRFEQEVPLSRSTSAFVIIAALGALGWTAVAARSSEVSRAAPDRPPLRDESIPEPELARTEPGRPTSSARAPGMSSTRPNVRRARTLTGPKKPRDGLVRANIPDLDTIIEHGDSDSARTSQVEAHLKNELPPEAEIGEVNVRCVESFCRVVLVKRRDSPVAWHEINDIAFARFATGETVFATQSDENISRAYVYFADDDTTLPIGVTDDDEPQDL